MHTLVETSAARSTKGNEEYLGFHGVSFMEIFTPGSGAEAVH